jgi:hypothetical protein
MKNSKFLIVGKHFYLIFKKHNQILTARKDIAHIPSNIGYLEP